jgi:plastocyanin
VSIANFLFQPNSVSIAVNDIVKWTNNDTTTDHTVTSGTPGALDGKFDSGNLAPNATVCMQFMAAGLYQYFCNIHPNMTGVVTVQ